VALRTMYRRPRAMCRRGHAKEVGGRCKECDRLTYKRRAAARKAKGLQCAAGHGTRCEPTACTAALRSENAPAQPPVINGPPLRSPYGGVV
jgi:hypothetical protein